METYLSKNCARARLFVPGKPIQPSLIFVGNARGLPYSGAPERYFPRVGSGLTHKHWTRLEGLPGTNTLAYYKHSKITVVRNFMTLGPAVQQQCYSTLRYNQVVITCQASKVGDCNICVKWKISVINKTKWDEISLKPKVYDCENLHRIPWTFIKVMDEICKTFGHFSEHEWKLTKWSWYLTVFPSDFKNIFLKSFGLLPTLTRDYELLQWLMRFHKILVV